MSIRNEITMLERRAEDLDQALEVAINEQTGREPEIRAEQARIRERIAGLAPFAEAPVSPENRMPACRGCGRAFWLENLTDGRCDTCIDRLRAEGPSESIQTVPLKRTRAPKS